MNMGRDAMGTMANTLIMVFVGSSFLISRAKQRK